MNTNNQVIIGGIIVLVVLVAGWWLTTKPTGSTSMATSTGSMATSTKGSTSTSMNGSNPTVISTGESVSVKDQAAGNTVMVDSVTLNQVGWVAVRDENGRVLGAARLDMGTHTNVSVPLLRATVAASNYQILLYADDGDKQFDLHKDSLITGADGGVAGANFKTK